MKNKNRILERITELEKDIYRLRIDYTESLNPKPEEKPLIVKDGETKVKRENGQDFLLLNPHGEERYWLWKSFNEITELTDEIAKLHPIVVDKISEPCKYTLWGYCNRNFC